VFAKSGSKLPVSEKKDLKSLKRVFAKLDLCEYIYKKNFKKSPAIKWQETSENCKKHQKPSTTSLSREFLGGNSFKLPARWPTAELSNPSFDIGKMGFSRQLIFQ